MMMMIRIYSLIFFIILLFPSTLAAQQNNDLNAWTSLELAGNLTKKIELSFRIQTRFDKQITHLRGVYYSLDGSKNLKNKWSIEAGLRLTTTDTWNRFRMRVGLAKRLKINKLDISFRALYQLRLNEFGLYENYRNIPISTTRFKIQVQRKLIKHVKIKLFTEPLWRLESGNVYLRRIRNSAGISYEFAKNATADISYIYQPQFYPNKTINIISFSLSYDIPKKRNKDKKKKVEALDVN